jgi:hypothetical protein
MKRIIAFAIFSALTAGTGVFAQAPEKTTVSGTLGVYQGRVALESGDTFYYVAGINHLIGFIDGLKEGASVSLEGYVFRSPENGDRVIRASALTVNGKNYSLIPDDVQDRPERDRRHHGFPGAGRGNNGRGGNYGMPGPGFGPGRLGHRRGTHNAPGRDGRGRNWRRN